jgi:hypothetical protein
VVNKRNPRSQGPWHLGGRTSIARRLTGLGCLCSSAGSCVRDRGRGPRPAGLCSRRLGQPRTTPWCSNAAPGGSGCWADGRGLAESQTEVRVAYGRRRDRATTRPHQRGTTGRKGSTASRLLMGPALDIWPEPQLDSPRPKIEDGSRHVAVPVPVLADGVEVAGSNPAGSTEQVPANRHLRILDGSVGKRDGSSARFVQGGRPINGRGRRVRADQHPLCDACNVRLSGRAAWAAHHILEDGHVCRGL